jgi:hypothetical protein
MLSLVYILSFFSPSFPPTPEYCDQRSYVSTGNAFNQSNPGWGFTPVWVGLIERVASVHEQP